MAKKSWGHSGIPINTYQPTCFFHGMGCLSASLCTSKGPWDGARGQRWHHWDSTSDGGSFCWVSSRWTYHSLNITSSLLIAKLFDPKKKQLWNQRNQGFLDFSNYFVCRTTSPAPGGRNATCPRCQAPAAGCDLLFASEASYGGLLHRSPGRLGFFGKNPMVEKSHWKNPRKIYPQNLKYVFGELGVAPFFTESGRNIWMVRFPRTNPERGISLDGEYFWIRTFWDGIFWSQIRSPQTNGPRIDCCHRDPSVVRTLVLDWAFWALNPPSNHPVSVVFHWSFPYINGYQWWHPNSWMVYSIRWFHRKYMDFIPIRKPPMAFTGFDGIISFRRQSLDDQRTSKPLVDSVDASIFSQRLIRCSVGSSDIISFYWSFYGCR